MEGSERVVLISRNGRLSGVDAMFASWFTGADYTGELELTEDEITVLSGLGIDIIDKGENDG